MRKIEILLLTALICVGLYLVHLHTKSPQNVPQIANFDTLVITHTDTLIIRDTITKIKPTPRRVDTLYIDSTQHVKKTYEIDSIDYKVHITTDNFDVDSIRVMMKYPIITNNSTVIKTNTIYKKKHWGFTAGVGVGVSPRGVEPFVGIMWGYRF